MKTTPTRALLTGTPVSEIDLVILIAGGHLWSQSAIDAHMRAEAAKLKPNWLYYLASCLPFGASYESRINVLCSVVLLGSICLGAWSFFGTLATALYNPGLAAVYVLFLAAAVGAFWVTLWFACTQWLVKGPGYWVSIPFDRQARYLTLPVMRQIQTLEAMLPGVRMELSLLYQDKEIIDPVAWILPREGDTWKRRPFIVWDGHGQVVLPPN